MQYLDWNSSAFAWEWLLWFGIIVLMLSSVGNWGYAYRAHRKFDDTPRKDAASILDERYAGGELTREQYHAMKADIATS